MQLLAVTHLLILQAETLAEKPSNIILFIIVSEIFFLWKKHFFLGRLSELLCLVIQHLYGTEICKPFHTFWRKPHQQGAVYSHLLFLAESRGTHALYAFILDHTPTSRAVVFHSRFEVRKFTWLIQFLQQARSVGMIPKNACNGLQPAVGNMRVEIAMTKQRHPHMSYWSGEPL